MYQASVTKVSSGVPIFSLFTFIHTLLLLPVANSVISVLEVVRLDASEVTMFGRESASSERACRHLISGLWSCR
jgi:hypothetical protein